MSLRILESVGKGPPNRGWHPRLPGSKEQRVFACRLHLGGYRIGYWRHTNKHTVVHLHVGQIFTPEVVWLASKIVGFKYVIHLHGDFTPSSAAGRIIPLYKKLFLNRAIRGASATLVLSNRHMQEIRSANPKVKNIKVISNGITNDFFKVPRKRLNSSPRLLFVGRLSPAQRDVAGLLESTCYGRYDDLGPRHHWRSVSADGNLEEPGSRCRGNLSGVRFHGRLSRESIKHFYSTSDAFILPCTVEPQGIVLLEAMACRIPVIVSEASGLTNTIRGSGIIVEPTAEGIALGIKEFMSMSPAEAEVMAGDAFRKVQELSWTSLLDTYLDLYEEAAQ